MPDPHTLELLRQWALWSVLDAGVGPEVDRRAGSAEGMFIAEAGDTLEEVRRPRVVICSDELALTVERAVLRCGVVLAASLRSYFILRQPCRNRGERDVLREALRRVDEILHAADHPQREVPAWSAGGIADREPASFGN